VRRGAPAIRSAPRRSLGGDLERKVALALLMALGLLAAPTAGCKRADPQQDLQERALEYLKLRQKREWTAIYQGILDPEVRKGLKLEDFLRPRKESMDMLGFELLSAQVDDGTGSVRVKVDVVIPVLSPRGGTTMMRKELEDSQHWVHRDGRWYIQLKS
jgi:hypothetical protein